MKLDAQGVVIADEGLRPQHGSGNKCGTTVDGEGEFGFGCDWMLPRRCRCPLGCRRRLWVLRFQGRRHRMVDGLGGRFRCAVRRSPTCIMRNEDDKRDSQGRGGKPHEAESAELIGVAAGDRRSGREGEQVSGLDGHRFERDYEVLGDTDAGERNDANDCGGLTAVRQIEQQAQEAEDEQKLQKCRSGLHLP